MSRKNKLVNSKIKFPRIVYGTSFLGNLYRELSDQEKMAIMKEWFNASNGPVMIDTAGKYGAGLALEVIGNGLEQLGIEPDQITISNKLGWYRTPLKTNEPTFEPGVWANLQHDSVQKISYDGILECWKQGCDLLEEKYKPALVSVHDPDEYLMAASDARDRNQRLDDILGAYRALFDLKAKGEVKGVGIGAKDWLVIRELYEHISFDWVMLANKFTIYNHSNEIMQFMERLHKNAVAIINSAIFNGGFLTGGEYFDYRIPDPDNPMDQPLFQWREKFFAICEKHQIPAGDACLKFAFSLPQITAVALNPSKPKRISHNQEVLDKKFPKAFWDELKEEGVIQKSFPHL
ncbi:MAG: aldo/keto reductase [Marinilabilia sp.]